MNKFTLSLIACFILVLTIANISATPPLPSIKDQNVSTLAINSAQTTLSEAEILLLQAKKMDLKGYGFWDKIFIKYRVIKDCEKEINKAKKSMKIAEIANENKDFNLVSASVDEIENRARYAIHNLKSVLAGKTRSDWTKVDSITTSGNETN